ncbi:hypothetical protein O6H91_17G013900 [Diphasiastrum complanatum]|uniref:Uncharacterized protein n=3 Tax=Diphasiastrum complanatum TaxID=34168 RepID=A0ACC2B4A1_DIPCM|nr:hypothetical protein O6H91_17G013900 [Diphasiastrum complanatum]KAJ7524605.1 hypothetical protein O6H91_17G013900 [Diphasiastrum complanatum]KAJ7524606.1 hypothetical protein O6H91_17G013900 [Diphasiastrum complanatum]
MAYFMLHGMLQASIFGATDLVDESRKTGAAPTFFRKIVEQVEDTVGLGRGVSKLYATIDLEKTRVGRTRIIKHDPVNPEWNESFNIYCAHNVANIVITVKEDNRVGATTLGRAKIPVTQLLSGRVLDHWYDLYRINGTKVKGGARVRVYLRFFHVTLDPNWDAGLGNGFSFPGVPFTYFKQHTGCKVTLYQDTHMPNNFLPKIYLAGGALYQPTSCWEDMYQAISNAQHFIYIAGWSVYTKITLIRNSFCPTAGDPDVSIGELLKKKAEMGVRVLLLVWDDRTSVGLIKQHGVMKTHDQETLDYFRHSNVKCVLTPRNPYCSLSLVRGLQIGALFTHHQKTVTVDAPISGVAGHSRHIISFVGGLDFANGRYDTQYHSLFRTLSTVHSDDFRQTSFPGANLKFGGPREPWHDIHSKLEGPAAWDVLRNFEQRWLKQASNPLVLLPIRELRSIDPHLAVISVHDPNTWNVQIFRSIDAGAVDGFPENPNAAAALGLVSDKDNTIDRSIHDAYINAIRRAKHFIYVESQYFLGSSFAWDGKQDAGALHLIPREIALKIVSKVEAGERFSVYIVIPMWPEGVPESPQVQAILDWIRRTMDMMYRSITKALQAKDRYDVSPKDYLSFFCLGNREAKTENEYVAPQTPETGSNYRAAQDSRRFMIYVHSKMMIVDDEYIIVGSANINQRSMDGGRDTEIAMGAYQPYHVAAYGPPRGYIHGFRMSLWYEHLGVLDDDFLDPSSLKCIRKVNTIADDIWNLYTGTSVVDLPGHLLPYPVAITKDGAVTELPGFRYYPDTKASVLGSRAEFVPDILTT